MRASQNRIALYGLLIVLPTLLAYYSSRNTHHVSLFTPDATTPMTLLQIALSEIGYLDWPGLPLAFWLSFS